MKYLKIIAYFAKPVNYWTLFSIWVIYNTIKEGFIGIPEVLVFATLLYLYTVEKISEWTVQKKLENKLKYIELHRYFDQAEMAEFFKKDIKP
jgi:hypothetical protein